MPEESAEVGTETPQEPAAPSIEEIAKAQGWNPDHEGPDKIGAEEFVRRKPLFDKIKNQNSSIKRLEKLVEGMATTFKATTAAQYQKGIADAEAKMKEAKAAYDIDAFEAAQQEKQALEAERAKNDVSIPASDQALIDEFCDRNKWFDNNKVMRTDALELRERFVKRNPDATTAEVLEYIETKMKKDYPEAFESATPARKSAVSAVESASTSTHTDPLAKLKASMSAEEKRIMAMFTKNGNMTEKEYLESYSTVRER